MASNEVTRIGQYEIRDVLGRGGMATVYRAYQPSLDREVAVKVMSSQFSGDEGFLERFKREARAIGSLRHPNILAVYDFGQDGKIPYIVTELLEGKTLRERLGAPLDPKVASKILTQMASALDYAHEKGIIHRDVKPSNVLMGDHDRAVLSDFGIVKLMQNATTLTATGVGVGTPDYMSPEQGTGEPLDGRSDQYSLWVVLYKMLTGVTPFRGDTPLAVLMGHVNRPLPDPLQYNPRLSPQVVQVLRKSLAKNREERYKTCREFAEAFEKAVDLSTVSLPVQPPVMSGEATMVQALTPQQVYDLALEQERHGNYQAAYETLNDLNRQFPNYADVPTRLMRYEQSNYRYTGTHSMYRPSSTATNIPAAGPTQIGGALPTQIGGPYTPPPQTGATEIRSFQPTGNTPPPQNFYGPPTTGNYPVTQKSGGNKGLLILGIVGGLALVAVAVLVILLVTSGKPNPTQVSNITPASSVGTTTAATTTSGTTTAATTTAPTTGATTTAPTTAATTTPPVTTQSGNNDPLKPQVDSITGKLYNSQADFKTTVTALRNLTTQNPKSWLAYRELGIILYLWNIEGGEIDALQKAVSLNDKDARSHAYLSMAYHDGFAYDKSLTEATRAIELDPNDSDSRAAYSMALEANNEDVSRVAAEAQKALDLDKNGLWAHWAAFLAASDAEKYDEAHQHIDFLINKYPNFATFYSAKAGTYREQGDDANATTWYTKAIAIEPHYAYAHAGLGWIDYNAGKYDDAEKEFKLAVQYNDSYDYGHTGYGYILNYRGRFDEAIDQFKRAVQINPRASSAYNGLSFTYIDKADASTDKAVQNQLYGLAIEAADNALKYIPDYVDATFNKGRALYSNGKYTDAEPLLKKAVDKAPKTNLYRIYLAYNYFSQKNYNEARNQAQECLKVDPQYQPAQKLLDEIKKATGS